MTDSESMTDGRARSDGSSGRPRRRRRRRRRPNERIASCGRPLVVEGGEEEEEEEEGAPGVQSITQVGELARRIRRSFTLGGRGAN